MYRFNIREFDNVLIKSKNLNFEIKFRDLPVIPKSKILNIGENRTLEQKIADRLLSTSHINSSDEFILDELSNFYKTLNLSLRSLDYSSFSDTDFEDFKNYLVFALNHIVLLSNNIVIDRLYRIVVNEQINGSKNSLTKKSFLTYPPLHIVQKNKKYNRANTPNTTVFYGSESIDTALNEVRPNSGDVITIGFWEPTKKNIFNSYPITHSFDGYGINYASTRAVLALLELRQNRYKKFYDSYMEPHLSILGYEFSKPIKHHYEYLISSMLAEEILNSPLNRNTYFDFECLIYPSVGNKFQTSNLAIKSEVFRNNFELSKVIELEVTSINFERAHEGNSDNITLVDYKNIKITDNIDNNDIIW